MRRLTPRPCLQRWTKRSPVLGENHEAWRNTLVLLFRSVEIIAIVIIFLIGTVAFAAIISPHAAS